MVQPEVSTLMAYGIYLMNGGNPNDFGEMTREDVEIMLNTYYGLQESHDEILAKRIARAMMGGDERWAA